MILVVDASAIAAVLFDEPGGDTVRAHCRGETLLAPRLIDYELANVAWKRVRRQPADELVVMTALHGLRALRIDRRASRRRQSTSQGAIRRLTLRHSAVPLTTHTASHTAAWGQRP